MFLILLHFGWMVDLAMSIFEFLTKVLVIWDPWHPWVCIRSVCCKWNLKQIEAIPPSVYYILQLWIVNYCVKSLSNNLRNGNIKTGVSDAFKTKSELKCQNELFLNYHFSGNTSLYVFINHYWDYLINYWRNNWRSIIDIVERHW